MCIILIIITICNGALHGMLYSSSGVRKKHEPNTKINNKFVYGTYLFDIVWFS